MAETAEPIIDHRSAHIPAGEVMFEGTLNPPQQALAVVLFAHGSGSGRHSPRNQHVVNMLNEARLATLLMDLLTREEKEFDLFTGELRFNTALLAHRLVVTTEWLTQYTDTRRLPIGYFGASTGAVAALVSAAQRPDRAGAVVSRDARRAA
jgi:pimeloyl-ACP methyl ester carboxylesterase